MSESSAVSRRRQSCARCGQVMFEFYCSPDGHFGVVGDLRRDNVADGILCPTCGAPYRLLDRLDAMGQPIERR